VSFPWDVGRPSMKSKVMSSQLDMELVTAAGAPLETMFQTSPAGKYHIFSHTLAPPGTF